MAVSQERWKCYPGGVKVKYKRSIQNKKRETVHTLNILHSPKKWLMVQHVNPQGLCLANIFRREFRQIFCVNKNTADLSWQYVWFKWNWRFVCAAYGRTCCYVHSGSFWDCGSLHHVCVCWVCQSIFEPFIWAICILVLAFYDIHFYNAFLTYLCVIICSKHCVVFGCLKWSKADMIHYNLVISQSKCSLFAF